jgi:hypothetical protein
VCVCVREREREPSFPFQQRKESKKPPAKLQPRALEGWLHPEDRGQAEETEEELEIRVGTQAPACSYNSKGVGVWRVSHMLAFQATQGLESSTNSSTRGSESPSQEVTVSRVAREQQTCAAKTKQIEGSQEPGSTDGYRNRRKPCLSQDLSGLPW